MEKSNSSGAAFSLKMGGILGGILIVYTVFLHAIGQSSNQALGYISYLLMLAVIIYAIKTHRDQNLGGFITFGEGVKLGILISLFAGILIAAFSIFLIKKIDPSMEEEVVKKGLEEAMKSNPSEAQLKQAEGMIRFFMKPYMLFIMTMLAMLFFGVIESLIVSAIFKKNKDGFDAAMKDIEN